MSCRGRLKRAEDALAQVGDHSEDALAADADAAASALEAAQAAHAEKAKDAPDLAATKSTLTRAESVDARAREEIARLKPSLARLDERISRSSGDAVEERLAEAEQELEAARATLARIEHDVAVLTRLENALESARNEARERYFAPIAKELRPLLHLLWPEAELTWGEESLLPDALIRNGQEEPIDILSGGTQEQVALLVRLAFARMLSHAGRVAPVILDDALVFTDDDRIERMFDALHRQAADLQIIVLTCRQRAFRDLGGNVLRLSASETEGDAVKEMAKRPNSRRRIRPQAAALADELLGLGICSIEHTRSYFWETRNPVSSRWLCRRLPLSCMERASPRLARPISRRASSVDLWSRVAAIDDLHDKRAAPTARSALLLCCWECLAFDVAVDARL